MGIGFLWAIVLGFGILLFPESPRFDYRNGKHDKSRATMAKLHGVHENHKVINRQLRELEEKLEAERQGGDHPWYEVFVSRTRGQLFFPSAEHRMTDWTPYAISNHPRHLHTSISTIDRSQLFLLLRHRHILIDRSQQFVRDTNNPRSG